MKLKIKGFTMIELVVAMAIVFLLVAVAVVSFHDHMMRKARAEARTALVELSDWMRHHYMRSGSYQDATLPFDQTPRDGAAVHRLSLVAAPLQARDPDATFPAVSASTFTLRAEALNGDTCASLLLDSSGRVGVLGESATVAECWR